MAEFSAYSVIQTMHGAIAETPEAAANSQLVREHLDYIAASPQFAGAPKLAKFLTFVVETALAGQGDQIKESLIAVEVYGRRPDYNPQIDSTVRVEAGRLRARLRAYYEGPGQDQPLQIELPKGGYVPVFHVRRRTGPHALRRVLVPALTLLALIISAAAVAGALLPRGHGDTAVRPETMELYLRAYELLRLPVLREGVVPSVPPTVIESVRLFEEVTRAEPSFARGWVGLAEANEWLYEIDRNRPPERLIAAKAAALRAVDIDPGLPEAWTILTSVLFFREWDIPGAEAACRRALDLNPRDTRAQEQYVDLLRMRGRADQAAREVHRAASLLPSAPNLRNRKALLLLDAGQWEEAIREGITAEAINPGKQQMAYTRSLWIQAAGHQQLGRVKEAEALYRRAIDHQPHDPWSEPSLAHLLAVTGREAEALEILAELRRQLDLGRSQHKAIALVYIGLRRFDEAIHWLERGFIERDEAILFTSLDWRFEPLRSKPRYEALLARIRQTSTPGIFTAVLGPVNVRVHQ
jgi:tetratricopeptide (TPR) repeat protein